MLIVANGMVSLYEEIADGAKYHSDKRDLNYDKQRVANGLGSVVLMILLLNMLDKVYYRERWLPTPIFNWLNRYYVDAEQEGIFCPPISLIFAVFAYFIFSIFFLFYLLNIIQYETNF